MSDHQSGDGHARADADGVPRCATCGSRVEATEWHPIATGTDGDGRFRVYAFCDAACRDAWGDPAE